MTITVGLNVTLTEGKTLIVNQVGEEGQPAGQIAHVKTNGQIIVHVWEGMKIELVEAAAEVDIRPDVELMPQPMKSVEVGQPAETPQVLDPPVIAEAEGQGPATSIEG
jgi:hypothetical protein